jgi:recombination protein RecR
VKTASSQSTTLNRLVDRFSRLPGIGRRSAERMAFFLLKAPPQEAQLLAQAISDLKTNLRICSTCGNLAEADPCPICSDPQRDAGLVLVVEQPSDLVTLEATGQYRGVYHVLMGRLSPLDGVGPGELNISGLLARVKAGGVREVILGTHPTLEGDGTALYLGEQLGKCGVRVTRLARGLPTGANLESLSKAVLGDAIQGRQEMAR